jgi:tRNA threonylcarbamoyladenosine modification (KEOPS) complex  Pcc1 subunit
VKKLQAKITLEYDDEKTAKAIGSAVSPDNFKTPSGLIIKTESKGNQIITGIEAETKLATFISTIDDLLFSVSTAEKALGIMKKNIRLQKDEFSETKVPKR